MFYFEQNVQMRDQYNLQCSFKFDVEISIKQHNGFSKTKLASKIKCKKRYKVINQLIKSRPCISERANIKLNKFI